MRALTKQTLPGRPLHRLVSAWDSPLLAGALALLIYGAFAWLHGSLQRGSSFPYFNYLADALLQGQLALRLTPPSTHDLSHFAGKLYLYWPPFPAVLLMPWVALWGVGASDVLFTVIIGALGVAAVAWLLRLAAARGVAKLDRFRRGALVLCFALGSVHFTLVPFGRVWFTAQVIGALCLALAYVAAVGLRGYPAFALAGLGMACALATRNHMVFAGLWPAFHLIRQHRRLGISGLLPRVLVGLLPVLGAIALLAAYNHARFGSVLENGLRFHEMGIEFMADYRSYGAFHPHYVPTNLYYQYVYYPLPWRLGSDMGGSLFLLTPLLFGVLRAFDRAENRLSGAFLASSIVLVAIPILLLMGTGYVQFGPRYTLDFTVPLLLLTALGIRRWRRDVIVLLLLISVTHYTAGALHFSRHL